MKARIERRRPSLGALALLAALLAGPSQAQTSQLIRRDVSTLADDGPELASLRRGIAAMQALSARDPTDPRGWIFQANMHGADDASNAAWNQCQHGSYYFLSWHRMYVYYFERILRAAAQDPTLTLPYWNYSSNKEGARLLPVPYRSPTLASGEPNPLYQEARAPGMNEGTAELPESVVAFQQAFDFTRFASRRGSARGFGGQAVTRPVHLTGPHGAIEQQPHDQVHVLVGGDEGLMSDVNQAARDPIFWAHHANIDRLWNRWLGLGGGRANPSNTEWQDQQFQFFDETGSAIQISYRQFVEQHGGEYRYDDDPLPATVVAQVTAEARRAVNEPMPIRPGSPGPVSDLLSPVTHKLLTTPTGRIELGTQPVRVAMPVPAAARSLMRAMAGPNAPAAAMVLNLENIQVERVPGVTYEVYLNLPKGEAAPSFRDPHFVGNLSFFGVKKHGEGPNAGETRSFDVTRVVKELRARNAWNEDKLSVSFVARGLVSRKTNRPLPMKLISKPSIGQVTLTTE